MSPKSHLHKAQLLHRDGYIPYPTIMKAVIGRVWLKALSQMPSTDAYIHSIPHRWIINANGDRHVTKWKKSDNPIIPYMCKWGQQRGLARYLGTNPNNIYNLVMAGSLPQARYRRKKLLKLVGPEYQWLLKYKAPRAKPEKRGPKPG